MLKVYYNENSPNCYKVKAFLLEATIEHQSIHLDWPEIRDSDFKRKSPNGAVPLIKDGDIYLSESSAILLYLATKHKILIPNDDYSRAQMYQAIAFESSLILPTIGGNGIFGELMKPKSERDNNFLERLMPKAQEIGILLDKMLGNKNFIAGELSIADLQLYAPISKAIKYDVIRNPTQNIINLMDRIGSLPSVVEATKFFPSYQK